MQINVLVGQSKAELEEKRKKTLEEIGYVDNLLKTTAKEKTEGMNAVKIIGRKVDLRESVLKGLREEINLISERIGLNNLAIEMMEDDLVKLKSDYAKAVINSYKSQKGNPELIYILSAKDFNQGYKRLKYLQQVTKFRRRESEIILELKSQVESSKNRLETDLNRISDLKTRQEQQKRLLEEEQEKKKEMVKSLSNKERQLQKELEEKKRIARKIENEINRLIEEEKRKTVKSATTPEQKLIGESFAENVGRLPWPVEKGVITSHFGVHPHPVFKYLTEDNIGIEITSSGRTKARSVFQGEVAKVFAISGANMTVIIRHGKYLSVYANISYVRVKPGDKVMAKEEIGDIYLDPGNGNNSVLKFMIFETNMKYLDPENWISKN
ncbi:MAG: peptidoglycan DD-metalloendopeptidase family protein [Bacteroidales bacterium]|nr:peptidoglycan DD-metalloendopeptidase family protein [Bacteroidales bacterium]